MQGLARPAAAAAAAAVPPHQQPLARQRRACICRAGSSEPAPLVVVEGVSDAASGAVLLICNTHDRLCNNASIVKDVVTFHMTCTAEGGKVVESSKGAGAPLSFEVGAGEVMGNPLYQAFDGALRGLGVGDSIELEISGGEWKQELLFTVPREHPEVERLEGRYKNLGGLTKDLAVELANGSMAVVVEVAPEYVRLDANSMVAGKKLLFELEVLGIERGDSAS